MLITYFIILITVIISLFALKNRDVFSKLEFSPYDVHHRKQWYRIFSNALIHGSYMHLFINMWILWMFGQFVENFFYLNFENKGIMYFLILYVGGAFFASMPALKKHKHNIMYKSVGASGAVSAILFSAIIISPITKLYIFAFFPLPAFVFGALYLYYEHYMNKKQTQDRIAHDAHLGGAVYGIICTILLKPTLAVSFFTQIIDKYF